MGSDFGNTTYPVAAKDHRCAWCGQPIPKGEKHAHFAGQWQGEFQNWRMHSECLSANESDISEGFMPFEGERPPQASSEAEQAAQGQGVEESTR